MRIVVPALALGGDRRVLNGIVGKIRSGAPWRDVPARYGSRKSIYIRFRRWALDGMLAAAQAPADANADMHWLVSGDSTIVRAHQHAAGAKGGARKRMNRITPSDDPVAD